MGKTKKEDGQSRGRLQKTLCGQVAGDKREWGRFVKGAQDLREQTQWRGKQFTIPAVQHAQKHSDGSLSSLLFLQFFGIPRIYWAGQCSDELARLHNYFKLKKNYYR